MKVICGVFLFLAVFNVSSRADDWGWEYNLRVKEISKEHDVCPHLVVALIEVESAFRNSSISPAGAVGFMQLMPETARMLGVEDPADPVENLKGGIKYLSMLQSQFNRNIPLVLAAYNAGPAAVQRYGMIPPFDETRNFVFRVINRYEYYKSRESGPAIFEIIP